MKVHLELPKQCELIVILNHYPNCWRYSVCYIVIPRYFAFRLSRIHGIACFVNVYEHCFADFIENLEKSRYVNT